MLWLRVSSAAEKSSKDENLKTRMTASVLKQASKTEEVQKNADYQDKTQRANFRGNPLYQATKRHLNNSLNGEKRKIRWRNEDDCHAKNLLSTGPENKIAQPKRDKWWALHLIFHNFHRLTVVYVLFCSLITRITPKIRMLCFVLINCILLNLLCVWIK